MVPELSVRTRNASEIQNLGRILNLRPKRESERYLFEAISPNVAL